MKPSTILSAAMVALAIGNALAATVPDSMPFSTRAAAIVEKTEGLVQSRGCNPSICFALDSSGSINNTEWELEKGFVNQIIGVVSADPDGNYAAVKYGLRLGRITNRITNDADAALLAVKRATHLRARTTFIAPALGYCIRQLARIEGGAKKIVLLGDGRSNFDSVPPLDPATVAADWVAEDPQARGVSGVAINFNDVAYMRNIVGEGNVFEVKGWNNLLIVLEDLVAQVCGWDAVEF